MEWRDISGFPNYQVSDSGNVRNKTTMRVLKAVVTSEGYRSFGLGYGNMRRASRLVADAFLVRPSDDPKLEVAHNDGTRNNDHVSNLRWATKSENQRDRLKHGTHFRGDKAPFAKFTNEQVRAIKEEVRSGRVTREAIAKREGVSGWTIGSMCLGYTYKDAL